MSLVLDKKLQYPALRCWQWKTSDYVDVHGGNPWISNNTWKRDICITILHRNAALGYRGCAKRTMIQNTKPKHAK